MARRARPRRALDRLVADPQDKAQALAKRRGVALRTARVDVVQWEWPVAQFDVVAAIFIQFPTPQERGPVFAAMRNALKPGGLLLIEGYRPEQLNYKTGGPSQVENLYTRVLLEAEFGDLSELTISEHDSMTSEGQGHFAWRRSSIWSGENNSIANSPRYAVTAKSGSSEARETRLSEYVGLGMCFAMRPGDLCWIYWCAVWRELSLNLRRTVNRPIWLCRFPRLHRTSRSGDVVMKYGFSALCAAAICAGLAFSAAPAGAQNRMTNKECIAEWNAMKANNTVGDKKYRDFQKECLARTAAQPAEPEAAPAAPATTTTTAPAPAPTATQPAAKAPKSAATSTEAAPAATKPTDGRQAMYARERACGAEWKADKAAGKIEKGQTWPKYWSECNTRKKAEGL